MFIQTVSVVAGIALVLISAGSLHRSGLSDSASKARMYLASAVVSSVASISLIIQGFGLESGIALFIVLFSLAMTGSVFIRGDAK